MSMKLLSLSHISVPSNLNYFPLMFLKVLTKSQKPHFATSYKIFSNCHSKAPFANTDTCDHQTALAWFCVEACVRGSRPQPRNWLLEYNNNDGWSIFHFETQNNFISLHMLNIFHFNMCASTRPLWLVHTEYFTQNIKAKDLIIKGGNNRACSTRQDNVLCNVTNITLLVK